MRKISDRRWIGVTTETGATASAIYRVICETPTAIPEITNHFVDSRSIDLKLCHSFRISSGTQTKTVAAT